MNEAKAICPHQLFWSLGHNILNAPLTEGSTKFGIIGKAVSEVNLFLTSETTLPIFAKIHV